MKAWLKASALDRRFLQLWACLSVPVLLFLVMISFGGALKFVFYIFLVTFSASVLIGTPGWVFGFRASRALNFGLRFSAMIAGWVSVLFVDVGVGVLLQMRDGDFSPRLIMPGTLSIFCIFFPFVTIGVLSLYRAETWPKVESENEGTTA